MSNISTVFITGATGFVGTRLTEELIKHGYQVTGLARSQESASKLTKAGAKHVNGTLTDIEIVAKAAAEHDATIHLAFINDFANFQDSVLKDRALVEAIVKALEGTNKTLILTGGTLANHPSIPQAQRANSRARIAEFAFEYSEKGVRVINMQLPLVHGTGDQSFASYLVQIARAKNVSKYPTDGSNLWPAIHRDDLAVLYRIILEKAESGTTINAVAEGGISSKQIAEAIGYKYNLPAESLPDSEIGEWFGFLGRFIAANGPEDPSQAESFGWKAVQIGLLEDIEKNY